MYDSLAIRGAHPTFESQTVLFELLYNQITQRVEPFLRSGILCANLYVTVTKPLQNYHYLLTRLLQSTQSNGWADGRTETFSESAKKSQKVAYQLVGQAKRHATKIRHKTVGSGIFGRFSNLDEPR